MDNRSQGIIVNRIFPELQKILDKYKLKKVENKIKFPLYLDGYFWEVQIYDLFEGEFDVPRRISEEIVYCIIDYIRDNDLEVEFDSIGIKENEKRFENLDAYKWEITIDSSIREKGEYLCYRKSLGLYVADLRGDRFDPKYEINSGSEVIGKIGEGQKVNPNYIGISYKNKHLGSPILWNKRLFYYFDDYRDIIDESEIKRIEKMIDVFDNFEEKDDEKYHRIYQMIDKECNEKCKIKFKKDFNVKDYKALYIGSYDNYTLYPAIAVEMNDNYIEKLIINGGLTLEPDELSYIREQDASSAKDSIKRIIFDEVVTKYSKEAR